MFSRYLQVVVERTTMNSRARGTLRIPIAQSGSYLHIFAPDVGVRYDLYICI